MKAYTIFDDFSDEAIDILERAGVNLTVHPLGKPRPNNEEIKSILEEYDCIILGTSQKIYPEMFENITKPRIIATASVGLDHIQIPEEKKNLVTVFNTPKANAQSVAEYTIGCALCCCKRLIEGNNLYYKGMNNKSLRRKPDDLSGKIMGVMGAGNISRRIMEYANMLGMKVLCWTPHPERHIDLINEDVKFVSLQELVEIADVISVNLPNNKGTKKIISESIVNRMKDDCIFISVSRIDTIDLEALLRKAREKRDFYCCIDIDVDDTVVSKLEMLDNVIITPHIGGGTVETRKRMFKEVAEQIVDYTQ